jgi:hypothetical protein
METNKMAGPRPVGRTWTREEENELRNMRAVGKTATEIARKLKRTPGAVYARFKLVSETAGATREEPFGR